MRASFGRSMRRAGVAASLIVIPSVVVAQLPSASSAAFGMAGNFTAMARGYEAVAWNAANLAMPGRPAFSLGIGIFGGSIGLDPIDVRTIHSFSGDSVPAATREDWVNQARLAGGQKVRLDGGITPIAMSLGPIGLQVGSSSYTNTTLSADAFESLLFGNAGRTGTPQPLDLAGTSVRAGVFTTGALSLALPIPLKLTGGILLNEKASIALTGKYVLGNGLVIAEDNGSTVDGTEVLLRLPTVGVRTRVDGPFTGMQFEEYNGTNAGKGMAADLSLAWSGGPFRAGILVENVFNSFKWDTTMLSFRPGTGEISQDTSFTSFDDTLYSAAPQSLREIVAAHKFAPAIGFGIAFNPMGSLTLTADMRTQMGDENAIVIGPKSRLGVGAEWRILPFLPIRAGVASVTDGWQAGAGVGLRLLGYELGASTGIRSRGAAQESGFMIGVIGIGR
jgi:hypothetical protein